MKISEAKLIAESTGCKGCARIAEELELADSIARDQQRKLAAARRQGGEQRGKESQRVREIVTEWKRVFPEHADKAAEPGSVRWKKIEARLHGGARHEDCMLAPTGAKTGKHRFIAKAGTDIRHIFCSESMIEELAAVARGGEPQHHYDGPRGVQAILERLDGVRQMRDDEWQACCPVHDDRTASLRIGQGDKGAVVRCMAGCDTEQVLAAIDLTLPALFDREDDPVVRLPQRTAKPPESLPTAGQLAAYQAALAGSEILQERLKAVRRWTLPTLQRLGVGWDPQRKRLVFPIHDAQGDFVQLVDYSPKPPSGVRKVGALRGRPRDLWPAPEALDSPEILLVEGEPDAISGHELGMSAVAIPGAAVFKPAWAHRFDGMRVLICFDCDRDGRRAAQQAADAFTALSPVVPYVKVIDLDPQRDDGYDLSDFLMEGGTPEVLRRKSGPQLVEAA